MRRSLGATLVLTLVLGLGAIAPVEAGPRAGATWTEHYLPSGDGITMLHADVLRSEKLSPKAETPVILTVSPYFTHTDGGPNERFYDFLDVGRILERGYTYVMVDLPGFGGSGGCNDWGGVREQGAVKAAVEWAATQDWSTGKVALMGKSYDAWTGLMGIAQQPKGLAAVVAMEPVYSGYRYLYNDGVRFVNSVATPTIFQVYDAQPGSNDDPMYNVNGAPQAWCYGVNIGLQQQDDPTSPFWMERDLLPATEGKKTPLFLTQGFLETNTKPDAAFKFFTGMRGPKRAWFGQFDHVRGWEIGAEGDYLVGRDTFADEMMRFLDRHLRGIKTGRDPSVEVQDNLGRYRAEATWPPRDARFFRSRLNIGSYTDDGNNRSTTGRGLWSISQRLPYDAWLAGDPVVEATVDAVPRANLVANLYDIAPSGEATLVSRGTHLVRGAGEQEAVVEMYGQDWLLRKGHRLGVLLSSSNSDWWLHVPTNTTVEVLEANVELPFLRNDRDRFLDREITSRLRSHLQSATLRLGPDQIGDNERPFKLPPRLR